MSQSNSTPARLVIAGTVVALSTLLSALAFSPAAAQSAEAAALVPAGYTIDYKFGTRGYIVKRNSDGRTFYFRRGRLTFIDPRYSVSQQIDQIDGVRRDRD